MLRKGKVKNTSPQPFCINNQNTPNQIEKFLPLYRRKPVKTILLPHKPPGELKFRNEERSWENHSPNNHLQKKSEPSLHIKLQNLPILTWETNTKKRIKNIPIIFMRILFCFFNIKHTIFEKFMTANNSKTLP